MLVLVLVRVRMRDCCPPFRVFLTLRRVPGEALAVLTELPRFERPFFFLSTPPPPPLRLILA